MVTNPVLVEKLIEREVEYVNERIVEKPVETRIERIVEKPVYVEVEKIADYDASLIRLCRVDTGAEVDVERMPEGVRQQELDLREKRDAEANRPTNPEKLDSDDILVIRPTGSQLCRLDMVQTVDRMGHFTTGFINLSDFVPYRRTAQAAR